MPNHEKGQKYICDYCGLILFSRSGIRRHMQGNHTGLKTPADGGAQKKTEMCTICGVYTTRRNFKDHVNSHSTARNYSCEFCGTAVKSVFTLRKHIRRLHSDTKSLQLPADKRTQCDTCHKTYASNEKLRNHMERHRKEVQKFECNVCHLEFIRPEALKNHLIKHKGEWSYSCGLCTKIFKHSSSVSGHRKSHKVDGFYHCGYCTNRFNDYGQLKHHFDTTQHRFCIKVEP